MKKLILSFFLIAITCNGFSKIVTINNSGPAFTPASVTITFGDSVKFAIGNSHDAIEVSKAIWDANEASPLLGGFGLPKGGGLLTPEQLSIGAHYYVCTPHVSLGMKGTIFVLGPAAVPSLSPLSVSFFPNPVHDLMFIRTDSKLIGSSYQIIDLTGKQVSTGKLESTENQVNISDLNSGIYFLRTTSLKEELFRFIKN